MVSGPKAICIHAPAFVDNSNIIMVIDTIIIMVVTNVVNIMHSPWGTNAPQVSLMYSAWGAIAPQVSLVVHHIFTPLKPPQNIPKHHQNITGIDGNHHKQLTFFLFFELFRRFFIENRYF